MISFRKFEEIFTIISLMSFSGAIVRFIAPNNPVYFIVLILLYGSGLLSLLLMLARWRQTLQRLTQEKWLWVLLTIVFASLAWSETPWITLDRGDSQGLLPFLCGNLFGMYVATRYPFVKQLELIAWSFGISTGLSLILGKLVPSYGVMGFGNIINFEDLIHTGSWRGVYNHKTVLGSLMTLAVIFFLPFTNRAFRFSWLAWGLIGMAISLILLSTTKAALVILFLVVLVFLPIYRVIRWHSSIAFSFFVALALLVSSTSIIIVGNAETLLGLLGRDLTFTGRTEIWPAVWEKVLQRPWLGYAYNTFWQGIEGESADVWLAVPFRPPHAHNGFLDICLDVGLVGFSIFAIGFFSTCFRSIVLIRKTKTLLGLLPLAYLTALFFLNLTEGFLMRENIYWPLYVIMTLSTHRKPEELESDLSS